VPVLQQFHQIVPIFAPSIAVYLWRAGEQDQARALHAEHGAPLDPLGSLSLLAWCHGAELALYLGDSALAADAYDRLAPLAGRSGCASSVLALGPVDAYLAMAAAATGERDLAVRHADDALALVESWGIPHFGAWFQGLRSTYGY
jgi:hypothetical protein